MSKSIKRDANKIKLALIGNMNNNHFSVMRYLVDLGIDAHLLMFNNEFNHFLPINDTMDLDKWRNRIHTININAYGKSALYRSKKYITKEICGYDLYIGNAFTPGYFSKIGMSLDIFIPYSTYVDGLNYINNNPIKKIFIERLIRLNKKGLNNNTNYAFALVAETRNILSNFKCKTICIGIPMVYKEKFSNELVTERLQGIIREFQKTEVVIFSHVQHAWKNLESFWIRNGKSNHILIQGYAEYLKQAQKKSLLVLLEYGNDVDESKALIKKLGIEKNVLWLPKMSRKEIMILLDHVHLGGGELGGNIWGGTGWEFMSKGIPFFQYVNISKKEFKRETGDPFPPLLNVKNSEDICNHLMTYEANPQAYEEIGRKLANWFDNYGGIGLAKKYRDFILKIYEKKKNT